MNIIHWLLAVVLHAAAASAIAAPTDILLELGGLPVAQSVRVEPPGIMLSLQGGYVRRYYFRATTSYALYTAQPLRSVAALASATLPIRMVVTVLMKQFTTEQFRSSWQEQFAQALSASERQAVAGEIVSFMSAFETLAYGDQLAFDFIPGEGLRMSLRGELKLTIPGEVFARALFSVWLGPQSVDAALRRVLLDSPQ
jgi:Chalcone isomerase-like